MVNNNNTLMPTCYPNVAVSSNSILRLLDFDQTTLQAPKDELLMYNPTKEKMSTSLGSMHH